MTWYETCSSCAQEIEYESESACNNWPVPALGDDEAWDGGCPIVAQHGKGCEWVVTRAGRRDA